MAQQLKLTKNELRTQQLKLNQLEKYLPTLKLKKAMLQAEVAEAKAQAQKFERALESIEPQIEQASALFSLVPTLNADAWLEISHLSLSSENIAGVEVPVLHSLEYSQARYFLSQSPPWLERAVELLRSYKKLSVQQQVAYERVRALEKELQEVSIRVNLFEKVLIPRAAAQIKRVKVFLQDQELAAVSRSKVAKSKHRPQTTAVYTIGSEYES